MMKYLLIFLLCSTCSLAGAQEWVPVLLDGKSVYRNETTGEFKDSVEQLLTPASLYSRDHSLMSKIETAARNYSRTHSTPDKEAAWNQKFIGRIIDSDFDLNTAADEKVLDFLTPRRNQRNWDDYEALELCRMVILYLDKSWVFPAKVPPILSDDGGRSLEAILR